MRLGGLLLLVGCLGGEPAKDPLILGAVEGPPTSRGVLLLQDEGLHVQHDDTLGRVNPGVDHYPAPDVALDELTPGDRVELWLADVEGGRRIEGLKVTGHAGLPEDFGADHRITGTVVRVDGGTLTLDHDPIPGVMEAMVMPFRVGPRARAFGPGDTVQARLLTTRYGFALAELEKTGTGDVALRDDVQPIEVGDVLPAFTVTVEDGSAVVVGQGQDRPTALTFIYTRCPDPSFCPALVARLLALQEQVHGARILTVTLDPEFDTPEVLAGYGDGVGANTDVWRLGRLDPVALNRLALLSGLAVTQSDGRISHLLRLLVLDADGRLVERYDDNRWPMDRVVQQLRTGTPRAAITGTVTGETR